ncbi:high-temperature-induced dauer-formation protein-domain-containing protein [Dichotomocladium elegans]|nr:high-temperature-induced dauer-formation protein-domain-containing protein [Dichotomocladium elegans]
MGATDSKLAFRKGVFRLFEEQGIPSSADDYWSLFWTLPDTVDDVYTLIGGSDVRRARDSSRENLETLIDKLLDKMNSLVNAPNFPATPTSVHELLNCCRVFSRIIPYVFENTESAEWEDKIFWVPRSVERVVVPESVDDQTQKSQPPQYDTLPPRGEVLMALTLKSLFLAGFTLPPAMVNEDGSKVNYVIWESGVGSSTPIGSSRENDMHRIEVLRLLIVLLSRSMYVSPSQVLSKEDQWLYQVVAKTERKVVLALLCSLLNTACKYNPLGWGVPYNHMMFTDIREQLVIMCLRVLLVILDYHSPRVASSMRQLDSNSSPPADIVESMDHLSIQDPEKRKLAQQQATALAMQVAEEAKGTMIDLDETSDNSFKHYLSKLHRAQDFQFLIDGIYRILSNPMQANNTYLPGSTKRVRCHVEMMMLCWKLLETNSRFRNYLMETERALDLMVVLVYYAMENKLDPAHVGLVRMCAFILQTLSSDRTFGVKLNRTFDGHSSLPANIRIPAFHGTYADFLIISIFTLIATSKGSLSTLYPALILTITNISPYLKNLSVTSANKLMALFSSMSAPGFLLADEANHRLVGYLMESFNNIIQYQYSDNPNIVYAIVRSSNKFEKLRDFNLESAIAELDRIRQLKEEKQRQNAAASALPAPTSSHPPVESKQQQQEDAQPNAEDAAAPATESLSDKARGKRPEGSSSAAELSSVGPQRQMSTTSVSSMSTIATVLPGAKNGFLPTDSWVREWHQQLPLHPTLVLLEYLVPQVQTMCSAQSLTSDAQVLDFLRGITLVGILPPPQPIFIRKFRWGEALVIWFRSMLWGQAYVSSITDYCPWSGTLVKLFQIKQQPSPNNSNNSNSTTAATTTHAPPQPYATAVQSSSSQQQQ